MTTQTFISNFIKNQRDSLDLTQEELADVAGVDKTWIQKIENDAPNNREAEYFLRLMAVFGALQNDQKPETIDWSHLPQLSTVFSKLLMLDPISLQMFITLFPEYRRIAIRLKNAP